VAGGEGGAGHLPGRRDEAAEDRELRAANITHGTRSTACMSS